MPSIKAAIAEPEFFQDYMAKHGTENAKDLAERYTRCVWWARRQGSTQTACPPSCAGQVQYQLDGSRIVSILGINDLCCFGDEVKDNVAACSVKNVLI